MEWSLLLSILLDSSGVVICGFAGKKLSHGGQRAFLLICGYLYIKSFIFSKQLSLTMTKWHEALIDLLCCLRCASNNDGVGFCFAEHCLPTVELLFKNL